MTNISKSDAATKGVIVLGDSPFVSSTEVNELAAHLGWPVLPEPPAAPWFLPNYLAHAPLVAEKVSASLANEIETIFAIGRVGLSRPINALLAKVGPSKYWACAPALISQPGDYRLLPHIPRLADLASSPQPTWLKRWREASDAIEAAIAPVVESQDFSGVGVIRAVVQALRSGDVLHLGSSYSARDVEMYAAQNETSAFTAGEVSVYMNRGVNGIDGVISTAIGEALATSRPTYLICGDLTLLHDLNGLVLGADEPCPDITLVVIDNDGGGIFSTLENAEAEGFERVIATPLGKDISAILRAIGVSTEVVTTSGELAMHLSERPNGLKAIVARVGSREQEARLRAKLRQVSLS